MTPREAGFLLLSSHLGDPARKVLTVSQLRTLANRARELPNEDREMTAEDLISIGYDRGMAERMIALLSAEEQLDWDVKKGQKQNCVPITRISEAYPAVLRRRLGLDSPGCLWAKGDIRLLTKPAVALVGSRELKGENRGFAREVGRQAALQGYVLISGNARGADSAAQESCLEAGGQVISVVADCLEDHPMQDNVLYLSEDGFDLPFSAQRALSRNRIIHSLGKVTFAAQCDMEKGGTWDGTTKNLRFGWSPVFCFGDGSEAMTELSQMGAALIGREELEDFQRLQGNTLNFIDQ